MAVDVARFGAMMERDEEGRRHAYEPSGLR
jgi:hypothetical protein